MIKVLSSDVSYVCYHEDEVLHKITVTSGYVPDSANFNIVRDDVTGIISKNADKLSGVRCICEELKLLSINVTVVGNSENDISMLSFFQNSIAVLDADESAKKAAKFICKINDLVL